MSDTNDDYKKQISDLLDNYEDGRDVFIKNDWDWPLKLKPGAHAKGVSSNYMDLVEQVTGIIAKSKYGLDTYPNEIEILDSEQMLDVYVNIGMPSNYVHWSHGKEREKLGRDYMLGMMNLAYELVINSNPSISYCMTHNTNTMMALVIAHAAQGHNAFFKNNVMFTQFTNAAEIRGDLKRFADFVTECEEKYGVARVERILDACHALQQHAIDYTVRPVIKKTAKQKEMHKAAVELTRLNTRDVVIETLTAKKQDKAFRSLIDDDDDDRPINENNLLRYIGNAAPHLKDWERKIITMFCDRAQYFYPQGRTKVMNEGFASFWHYKILHDMHDLKLISDSMMMEALKSHSDVLFQPGFTDPRYQGFNPYTLGFAVFEDLERICKTPTDEDRKWFPEIAGNPDWLAVHKEAAYNFHDESFIYQYLSPKVMRDFHMISLLDDDREKEYVVTAVHDDEGYRRIRASLAASYDLASRVPQIVPYACDERGDRTLMLKHTMHNRKPVHKENTGEVLKHIHQLWGHPVILASFNEDDKSEAGALTCPPNFPPITRGGPIDRFLNPSQLAL